MEKVLKKNQLVNSDYVVQFFISGNAFYQKYRVKDKDDKICLLKLYNSSKLPINSFSNGNLMEIEILALLNNFKGIIKFVANGEIVRNNQKYHFIVFNFVSGETLQDKLKRDGVFTPYSAVPLIIHLLETLSEIHNHRKTIIHNNINPDSISLDYTQKNQKPILTDFGFARYIAGKSNCVELNQLSPFYLAPELFNGISTPQSDIFSVGALLYTLIMGIPPWYVEIPSYQHTQEKFIDAIHDKRNGQLNFGIQGFEKFEDEHLKKTITKALALDVEERFKNSEDFIKALKRKVVLTGGNNKEVTPSITVKKEGAGFSAIAGMQFLKDILYNDVIRALNEKELYESYGITIPNGMLLYGPPGCGKTFISERFAEEVGFNFLQLSPSDIKSKYINATEEKIGAIFKEAVENAPTTIFIDEIDAVVPSREGNLHHMNASAVNEFLAQMSNCSEKGIFIIAASNRPEKIDSAILRTGRIDRIIYLPPPDYEARVSMFKLYLKKRPVDLAVNYEVLAKSTDNYVASDIKFLVDEASRFALKKRERITQEILEKIISSIQPSVSHTELIKYESLKNKFEDKKQIGKETNDRSIGF